LFGLCKSLVAVVLPTSWGSVTEVGSMFSGCLALSNITLPTSWGSVTSIANMFTNCSSLSSVILATSFGNISNALSAFMYCYSLKNIDNIDYLGSLSSSCNFDTFLSECIFLQQNIVIGSLISKIAMSGVSGTLLRITSIRLTNSNSTFGGTSPQIDISYTSLTVAAFELLLGDIPNGLVSKRITISGCTNIGALVSKASSGLTSGSTTVTLANTSNLSVGNEVYGNNLSTAISVSFTDTGDLVALVGVSNHGIPNGKKVSFASISTTTGITRNRAYFVVNTAANNFQVSETEGGSPVTLTNNGTGTMILVPIIVTINTNVSIILDVQARSTGTITMTSGVAKRSIALLKGWSVTG